VATPLMTKRSKSGGRDSAEVLYDEEHNARGPSASAPEAPGDQGTDPILYTQHDVEEPA
jgi:hypothetical protein